MQPFTIGGKWLKDLNADLAGNDRSCAVLAGAILDDRLQNLIKGYLLAPANEKSDKLFGRGGAIESFSIRIELASRLALVGPLTRKAFDIVREIRNDAAHLQDFSFGTDSIRDKVSNLVQLLHVEARASWLLDPPYSGPKGNFVAVVVLLVAALEVEAAQLKPLDQKPYDFLANLKATEGEA